jgi:hypothetical protein
MGRLFSAHNPNVTGSNPAPATNDCIDRGLLGKKGENLALEHRVAGDTGENADASAGELVALKVDAIVILVTGNAEAARRATADIPIVMMNCRVIVQAKSERGSRATRSSAMRSCGGAAEWRRPSTKRGVARSIGLSRLPPRLIPTARAEFMATSSGRAPR